MSRESWEDFLRRERPVLPMPAPPPRRPAPGPGDPVEEAIRGIRPAVEREHTRRRLTGEDTYDLDPERLEGHAPAGYLRPCDAAFAARHGLGSIERER